MKNKRALFLFRRDLRIYDNKGLNASLRESEEVIPCFILNPIQLGKTNAYRGKHSIQFMFDSLKDLAKQLEAKKGKLYLFYGIPSLILKELLNDGLFDALYLNKDYTPYSKRRDTELKRICNDRRVSFHSYADALLHDPNETLNKQNKPYLKFTPYYHAVRVKTIEKPYTNTLKNFYTKSINNSLNLDVLDSLLPEKINLAVKPGRDGCQQILRDLSQFNDYATQRDFLDYKTTYLSAHNKFGTVSIREVYHAIIQNVKPYESILKELFWRDFFYNIAYNFPHVFDGPFYKKYNNLPWNNNIENFKLWCQGKTGFPVIDAGIRQLNQTGYMHNRARLLTASFLVKTLFINWQWGEQYFAQQLADYDPSVNNGNWQWVASTGADAQPPYRIFNPWLQQKKFDPQCVYIKTWISELKHVDNYIIHNWFKTFSDEIDYPQPIVSYQEQTDSIKHEYLKIMKAK